MADQCGYMIPCWEPHVPCQLSPGHRGQHRHVDEETGTTIGFKPFSKRELERRAKKKAKLAGVKNG